MSGPDAGRAVAIAGNAAEALRALAAATHPHYRWPGLHAPGDAAGVLAVLALAAGQLEQSVGQLTGWLEH